jgi:hypothetical protein
VTVFIIFTVAMTIFTPTVRLVLHASGIKWSLAIRAIGSIVRV